MSEQREQEAQQRVADLLAGKQVPAHVTMGLDIDGRGVRAPLAKLSVLGSRVVLDIDDEENPELWLRVSISEELLEAICRAQFTASDADGNGEQAPKSFATVVHFDNVWDVLAQQGRCDSRGGMEYQRVRQQWEAAGSPLDVVAFVISHANQSPGEKTNS